MNNRRPKAAVSPYWLPVQYQAGTGGACRDSEKVVTTESETRGATCGYGGRLRNAERQTYVLRLYVTGFTPASTRAITNLKALCEENLKGRFQVEVIDIFQQPALPRGEQILATPTLAKLLPVPVQRFIGDLSRVSGKLFGLDLKPRRIRPHG